MKCLQLRVGLGMRMKIGEGIQAGRGGIFQGSTFLLVVWQVVRGIGSLELIPTQTLGSRSRNLLNQSNLHSVPVGSLAHRSPMW